MIIKGPRNLGSSRGSMIGANGGRGSKRRVKSQGTEFRFHRQTGLYDPDNLILAALPREERSRVQQYLEFVPLRSGDVLWEPNQRIESVYFPTSGMVSFVVVMQNGETAEVGITGSEGFVGAGVVLGAGDSPLRAVVQNDGGAFRIESALLRQVLLEASQLEKMLRRYAHAQAMQVAQASACNCLHQVSKRLARWLAITRDRTESDVLLLTQEFLAKMLGCRRSSVTSAMGLLQQAGVLRSGRGQVRILDRKRLEKQTCECYHVMKKLCDPGRLTP